MNFPLRYASEINYGLMDEEMLEKLLRLNLERVDNAAR